MSDKMRTNLLSLFVTMTISIIFIGSLLMPVISDAATTTYTNTATDGVECSYSNDFTFSKSADSTDVTINDTVFENVGPNALILSPEMILYQTGNPINLFINGVYTNITDVAFSGACVDGTLTYTIGTDEAVTLELTKPMIAVPDGDYVSIHSGSANVRDSGDIISWSWISGADILYRDSEVTVTPSSEVTTTFEFEISDGQVAFSSLSFTYGETSLSGNTLIVPKSYSVDNEYAVLYNVIPIVAIISVLLLGVGAIVVKGNRD